MKGIVFNLLEEVMRAEYGEVRQVYSGADVPVFDIATSSDESTMEIGYRSARKMCALSEVFIEGSANHRGEQVAIEQPSCMHHGDARYRRRRSGGISGRTPARCSPRR